MEITETVVKPDENLKITEIPFVTDKVGAINLKDIFSSNDQSRYISEVETTRDVQTTSVKVMLSTREVFDDEYRNSYSRDFTYDEIKKAILDKWATKPEKFYSPSSYYN
jgi:hypothetical protein